MKTSSSDLILTSCFTKYKTKHSSLPELQHKLQSFYLQSYDFFSFFFRFSKCFKTVSFVSGSLLEETGAGFMHHLLGCLQAESQSASQLCSQASGALPTALSLPASLGEREEDCWMALGWNVAM